jgi:hypothetical protein
VHHFPAGHAPELPFRQSSAAGLPQNGMQPVSYQQPQHILQPVATNELEPQTAYPNLLQELPSGMFEPNMVDRSLQQVECTATIEVSESENDYQIREDVFLPSLEENSASPMRPPSIKTLPPSMLVTGGVTQRPASDMLCWEPLKALPETVVHDIYADEDVFESAQQPDVQLVQQKPVEIEALQNIILQRKLGDGYFGDVWTGKIL